LGSRRGLRLGAYEALSKKYGRSFEERVREATFLVNGRRAKMDEGLGHGDVVAVSHPVGGGGLEALYRRLKGVRSHIRQQVRGLVRAAREGDEEGVWLIEDLLAGLTHLKTSMRKEFERRTGIKGPYRL